ncbi:MAG: hypothetical protein U9R36_03290, partial [Elusimicrobiota bacterium]|nr:hypothetical protein [Elusimicrobiota bacterium]
MISKKKEEKDLNITLSARKDARKRLLSALDEFDPRQDKEKIAKVKTTLTAINRDIKEIEKKLTEPASTTAAFPETAGKKETVSETSSEKRSIEDIDDSRKNLKTEIDGLKDKITHERDSWENKLSSKQREINSLKASMNLRQAQLRAEYQLKKQELERTRDEFEERLKRETSKEDNFKEERDRWARRLKEKQADIDELKVELSSKEIEYNKKLNELSDDYSSMVARLKEKNRNIKSS